jgi:YbaB/EbfC DNA-binding family
LEANFNSFHGTQPLLDFLHTVPAFIANAPPVIGVSEHLQVKVVLQLDRSLKNIFIDPQLLRSPSNLRANILEAIEDAQKFRESQVQLMISELARVAKLSLWDVEATLLAVKVQQAAASVNTHCCARNSLVSVGRGQRGDIDSLSETLRERLVLNSMGIHDSRELEGSIVDAAHQGHQKVRDLQGDWPFSELGLL